MNLEQIDTRLISIKEEPESVIGKTSTCNINHFHGAAYTSQTKDKIKLDEKFLLHFVKCEDKNEEESRKENLVKEQVEVKEEVCDEHYFQVKCESVNGAYAKEDHIACIEDFKVKTQNMKYESDLFEVTNLNCYEASEMQTLIEPIKLSTYRNIQKEYTSEVREDTRREENKETQCVEEEEVIIKHDVLDDEYLVKSETVQGKL